MPPSNADLRKFIVEFFSDDELETLCFDHFREVRKDFTVGISKTRKAISLIHYCETRRLLDDLFAALEHERPKAWKEKFGSSAPIGAELEPGLSPEGDESVQQIKLSGHLIATVFRGTGDPNRRIHEKTGIELIRIPAGLFLYGKDEKKVEMPEYWISRSPVTNEQFARFVEDTRYATTAERQGSGGRYYPNDWEVLFGANWRHPGGDRTTLDVESDHPVVQVSHDDALAFCEWAGFALPTEQEWEKAARGTDDRVWPWGSEAPSGRLCNFDTTVGGTTPVGLFSPQGDSPFGCVDMAGNVFEWTDSVDPNNWIATLRGGAWDSVADFCRLTYRHQGLGPLDRCENVGFRVVVSPQRPI